MGRLIRQTSSRYEKSYLLRSNQASSWFSDIDLTSAIALQIEQPQDFSYYYSVDMSHWISAIARTASTKPNPATILSKALESHFASRVDVEAIFLNQEGGFYAVTVIINHETYQREAMGDLIEHEYHLRQEVKEIPFDVDFLPRLGRSPSELVSSTATLVFQR